MVPMYWPPIWFGSVWVNRVRSGAMIVMNAMSVFVRMASVTGCNVSVARPDSIAAAVDGESASAVAMPMTCWRAAASPSRRGVEQCQRAAGQHHHRDHQDLQRDRLAGQSDRRPPPAQAQRS